MTYSYLTQHNLLFIYFVKNFKNVGSKWSTRENVSQMREGGGTLFVATRTFRGNNFILVQVDTLNQGGFYCPPALLFFTQITHTVNP